MSAQTSTSAPVAEEAPPNVAIRAKPPSPKRLSRKVLLGAAAIAGLIITTALMFGLSPQQPRTAAEQDAQASVSGPPETIAQAASGYDAGSFPPGDETELLPPEDPLWAEPALTPAPPAGASNAGGAAPSAPAAPDPETVARAAPILFASASATASTADRDAEEGRLDARLLPPRSRYEIQSGNVIPAALVTGVNSDLPGRVIAQVTAPVYDS